ncbi:hypothetical protein LR48_Vigan02g230700 [Vigna angularis]|uniref:Uncharacterized protein n=1 Tax=Phaseolus angularis TaxID=3914 RepID=A0A0L9U0G2_PHAAN|nr:hypothetical protein LR48_Vigan02g230700 [Vigna angularis]
MDYEADGFGANGEGESKRVGEGVSEEIVVGSDSLKSLDVEEDFQEAMEPREQVRDQGSELRPEEAVVDKLDDTNAGSSWTSALVDEQSSDVVQEPDSSKEAIGADSEYGNLGETDLIANQDSKWDESGNDTVHLDGVDSGVSGDGDFFYGNGNGDVEDEISSSLKIPSTKEILPIQEGSAADPNDGSNKDDQAQISDEKGKGKGRRFRERGRRRGEGLPRAN